MSGAGDDGPTALPRKEDPKTLVLRGAPRPPVRFRRGLIVGVTAAVAASVVGIAWLGLEPPRIHGTAQALENDGPAHERLDDALARLPKCYGDVPRLGPPLPGDLGRPILEQQRALDSSTPAPMPDSARQQERAEAAAAAEAELQRVRAQERAAGSSSVLVSLESPGDAPNRPQAGGETAELSGLSGTVAAGRGQATGSLDGEAQAVAARSAPSRWMLSAGTVIPATLVTGLNSDVPGPVLAQVSENVFDSATGRAVLVPQGARLIGSYSSAVGQAQRRAVLMWKRIVFPDGSSLDLDDLPATDASGYAGIADRVDFHTWGQIKGVMVSTLLGVGGELGLGGGGAIARAIRESSQGNGANAGAEIARRTLDVHPTITVRPGWPVRAIVTHDLVLQPWRG
jgi:type IV secretion system protein VirB10